MTRLVIFTLSGISLMIICVPDIISVLIGLITAIIAFLMIYSWVFIGDFYFRWPIKRAGKGHLGKYPICIPRWKLLLMLTAWKWLKTTTKLVCHEKKYYIKVKLNISYMKKYAIFSA